jgi:hypothetical protein
MPSIKVAHIREQNANFVIVPMSPAFGNLTKQQKLLEMEQIQFRAVSASLSGAVVPVWEQAGEM